MKWPVLSNKPKPRTRIASLIDVFDHNFFILSVVVTITTCFKDFLDDFDFWFLVIFTVIGSGIDQFFGWLGPMICCSSAE
jgi:hypothetical protein